MHNKNSLGPIDVYRHMDNGSSCMLKNLDHNYADPGSYWVTLIASNHGCADTAVGGKTSSGVDCEPGTYCYVIEMEYKDGNASEQTGFFTLIR